MMRRKAERGLRAGFYTTLGRWRTRRLALTATKATFSVLVLPLPHFLKMGCPGGLHSLLTAILYVLERASSVSPTLT